MFIETSSPRRPNDKARLESEEFQPTGSSGRCLKFWYHMYGSSIGSLNVWLNSNGSSGMIWSLSGGQQNQWRYGQAPVSSSNVYQVSTFILHVFASTKTINNITVIHMGTIFQSTASLCHNILCPPWHYDYYVM